MTGTDDIGRDLSAMEPINPEQVLVLVARMLEAGKSYEAADVYADEVAAETGWHSPAHWKAIEQKQAADKAVEQAVAAFSACDPATLRQQAAFIRRQAEQLSEAQAEGDMYRVTLHNLQQAASNMLTGVEVHNRLHPDAPARREDIAGPVITSLRAAEMSVRTALGPNPPTGFVTPRQPTQEASDGE